MDIETHDELAEWAKAQKSRPHLSEAGRALKDALSNLLGRGAALKDMIDSHRRNIEGGFQPAHEIGQEAARYDADRKLVETLSSIIAIAKDE